MAEVLPSTTVISTDLQAEHGIDYEAGIKSSWLQNRLYVEINGFYYRLKMRSFRERIQVMLIILLMPVPTKQRGIESQASYQFITKYQLMHQFREIVDQLHLG